jgi:hypothetical protein
VFGVKAPQPIRVRRPADAVIHDGDHLQFSGDGDPTHNRFVFAIDPRITEVELRDLALRVDGDGLTGGQPLLDGDGFRYTQIDARGA